MLRNKKHAQIREEKLSLTMLSFRTIVSKNTTNIQVWSSISRERERERTQCAQLKENEDAEAKRILNSLFLRKIVSQKVLGRVCAHFEKK
jgi:protein tyrosine phosphatase